MACKLGSQVKIDGKTKSEAIADIDQAINEAYRFFGDSGTPYSATLADTMRSAAVQKIEEIYRFAE